MKVMHLIAAGNTGGIQTLIKEYAPLSRLDNIYTFSWGGGPNEEAMRENGANTTCFNAHKIGTLKTGIELIKLFKSEKPEAVVVHSSPFLRYVAAMMHRIDKNIKVYFYCHADIRDQLGKYKTLKRGIYNYINRMCIKHSTKVIAISEYIKKTVIEYYNIPDNKVDVVYNAVNIKKFDTPIHQTTDKIMFVFVGRIVKVKGVQIALEALSKLPDYISWEFNIVGDGPYCHELEQKAKALGISDKVVFWGNRNDVPLILADMDIFLHVCTWEEGFGIGIIEAMAAGKLCICSNSGAIPEIITDKINGYLIEKNNVDQLDELLNDTIKNQKNWRTIQLEAKKTANKFGADKFAHELDELLSECRYEIYDSEQIQLK